MSAEDTDPHTLCPQCRGQRCERENTCSECREWSAFQWEKFGRRRKKKSKKDRCPSGATLKKEGSKDSSSAARTSSEAPTRSVSHERLPSGSTGPSGVSRPRGAGEGVASLSVAAPSSPPGEDILDFNEYDQTVSNDDLFQLWASLGLKGSPSKEALFDLIQLGAAVKQSPVIPEIFPSDIVDTVLAEPSDGSGQTLDAAPVADVAEGSPPPSEHPSRGEGSPTVSPAGGSPPRGSALTETPLRRTDDLDALLRGRIRRKARRPLRSRGLPSPYKEVRRRLFGSSSPDPSPEEEPPPVRSRPSQ
ncbi:uncharacterized protein [Palaemon carinicauda]|uniref:uncharacterized protein isoform X3 n=1 Tax=Palaemon carinicauda TaxID=392227 RepID=UPI0035B5E776